MAITKKEIEKIAQLARLELAEKEKEKLTQDLNGILDYMGKLNQVNTRDAGSVGHISGLGNVFRKDENPHGVDAEKIKKMVGQAPEREGNFVKTKAILEK